MIILVAVGVGAGPTGAQNNPQPPDSFPIRQWASRAEATSQYGDPSWGAMQATGAPDVTMCGDNVQAWASESATGIDTLNLFFETGVIASRLRIFQSFNPGAITSVDLFLDDGSTVTVPDSADPGTPCPGIFSLPIQGITIPVIGVAIHVDQTITGGWNEIDAVQLIGAAP